jgi:hypothetical protein
MRRMQGSLIIAFIAVLSINIGLYAQQDSLDFPAPQFMLPFYDHYTLNYMNVSAMGRGQTNNALAGKVDNAVNNPATLLSTKSSLYMELTIKPPISEMNVPDSMMYSSPIPFGMFGVSGRLFNSVHGALSYNVPKSLVYDNFTVETGQGADAVTTYPAYYLHQFTATLAGNIGKLRLGLNVHQQLHQFKDITVFQTFDRIDKTFYVVRLQPGIFYQAGQFGIGATFTPPASSLMNIKYAEYDVTLPMKASAGVSFKISNNTLFADADWEQCSKMSSAFDDRLTLKAGYEKLIRNITYRAGVISAPGVYQGAYRLPLRQTQVSEELLWWNVVPRGGYIKKSDQLFATAGFTYNFKGGELTLGLMQDLMGKVSSTQFATSLGFNLDTLKGRKFLIFDK